MMNKYILSLAAASLAFSACGDFLDKQPSASQNAPITEASQLMSLYDNWYNISTQNMYANYATDDSEISRTVFAGNQNTFSMTQISPYCLYRDGLLNVSEDAFWTGEYGKIYQANLIINSAPSVSDDPAVLNDALAGAYYMRAYELFDLTTYYCLPWCEANREALGMPLRLGLDYTENVSRGTLEQTYAQIFADLQAADELTTRTAPEPDMPWRVSQCAIDALYARIYLARGEYETAQGYAESALANAPELLDYNTLEWDTPTSYPPMGDLPEQELEYCETNTWSNSQIITYQEWIFPRLVDNPHQLIIPSAALSALYDQTNDLRFAYFVIEHGNRRMDMVTDCPIYSQFSDGRYVISGLTTQEMMLIKAECMARTGQWQDAPAVLTPLREARYKTGMATALTATTQAEALREVLAERRRELPFAFRLGDIKRFSVNETPDDDVTITRDFFDMSVTRVDTNTPKTWTIAGSSPSLAIPIFQTEINSSQGMIEQNPGE